MTGLPLVLAVRDALDGPGMPARGARVVVALSGGPDSVALLDAMRQISRERDWSIIAAHLDHALRDGSDDDRAFCARLCQDWNVKLETARVDVAQVARETGGGIEQAARDERYAFLRAVKQRHEAHAIAVAHTRDDQAETLLIRLLRGSGSDGLASMRAQRGDLIRPLLAVSRDDVLAHLTQTGCPWRMDPSNADLRFTRNRIRAELMPYLESHFNPRAREGLAKTAALLADEADVLDTRADALLRACAEREGPGIRVGLGPLRQAPRALARRALRRALSSSGGLRAIRQTHIEAILDMGHNPRRSGRLLALPGGRSACFRFDDVWLGRRPTGEAFALDLSVPGRVELPGGDSVVARHWSPGTEATPDALVPWPGTGLTVRTRRPGDRVRRKGRDVSLKRFLLERRVPADVRGRLPLVALGRHVLWVAGQPLDPPRPSGGARLVPLELRLASGDTSSHAAVKDDRNG